METSYDIGPDRKRFLDEYFAYGTEKETFEKPVNLEIESKKPDGSWKIEHVTHVYIVKPRDGKIDDPVRIEGQTKYGKQITIWGKDDGLEVKPTRIFDNEKYKIHQKSLQISGNGLISLVRNFLKIK